jgi:hypothetical protein
MEKEGGPGTRFYIEAAKDFRPGGAEHHERTPRITGESSAVPLRETSDRDRPDTVVPHGSGAKAARARDRVPGQLGQWSSATWEITGPVAESQAPYVSVTPREEELGC